MKKIKVTSILILIILVSLNTISFARTLESYSGIEIGGKDIVTYAPDDLTESDVNSAFNLGRIIITGLTTVGIILSVMMMIVLGIRYMIGSTEQRAEYKKTLLPMFLGCIFICLSATIVAVIYNMVNNIK
ncbi:MAG: hypothetical protein ACLTEH_00715 [Clostridia bacterium]